MRTVITFEIVDDGQYLGEYRLILHSRAQEGAPWPDNSPLWCEKRLLDALGRDTWQPNAPGLPSVPYHYLAVVLERLALGEVMKPATPLNAGTLNEARHVDVGVIRAMPAPV